MSWDSRPCRGGGGKFISTTGGKRTDPTWERDVSLAQRAFQKARARMLAQGAQLGKSAPYTKSFQIARGVYLMCRSMTFDLGKSQRHLSEKQLSFLVRYLKLESLPVVEEYVPASLQNLPKKPPQKPKEPEEDDG